MGDCGSAGCCYGSFGGGWPVLHDPGATSGELALLHGADCVMQSVALSASMLLMQPTCPCRQSCAAGEAPLCIGQGAGCSLSAVTEVSLLVTAANFSLCYAVRG